MEKKILEKIKEYSKIAIFTHIIPDGDAYGSQLGLKGIILENFPNKEVYASGEEASWLAYVGKPDDISNIDLSEYLAIVTDCGNVERIADQRYVECKELIKLDHHPDATPYGDLSWVDTSFTSASEMVAQFAYKNNLAVSGETARKIFNGILTDSGRFLFKGTTSRTFTLASFLLDKGFDLFALYDSLNKRKLSDLKITNYIYNNFKLTENGLGYIIFDKEDMEKFNLNASIMNKYANTLGGFEEILMWVLFSWRDDGNYRVEFRSSGTPVNEIAIKHGGGGHLQASGAIATSREQIDLIVLDCDKALGVK